MSSKCINPQHSVNLEGVLKQRPCGYCIACRKRDASGWSFRLMEEAKVSCSTHFITLTYDDVHVIKVKAGNCRKTGVQKYQGTLCKKHLQNFMKRLREAHNRRYPVGMYHRIKYYAVGEYGSHTYRPHYHLILFNVDIDLIQDAWCESRTLAQINNGYKLKHLGAVYYGEVNEASVGYTLKYVSKIKSLIGKADWDHRERQFSVMSKGLGKSYLQNEKMMRWHKKDIGNRMYLNLLGGVKVAMPRYYKDRIYSDQERKAVADLSQEKFVEDLLTDLFKCSNADKFLKVRRNRKEAVEASYRLQLQQSKELLTL